MKLSRALTKSVTWRIMSMSITAVIVFLVTGSVVLAGSIVAVTGPLKIVLYVIHEWLWERKKHGSSSA